MRVSNYILRDLIIFIEARLFQFKEIISLCRVTVEVLTRALSDIVGFANVCVVLSNELHFFLIGNINLFPFRNDIDDRIIHQHGFRFFGRAENNSLLKRCARSIL